MHTAPSLATFLSRAVAGSPLDGAELELQQADELPGDAIPFSALRYSLNSVKRKGPPSTALSLLGRETCPRPRPTSSEFSATGEAAFLGVMMPSVPAGEAVYNLVSAGPDAEPKAKDGAASATAGSFVSEALKPTRIPARFSLRQEDLSEDDGLEMAIRRDLSGLLGEALDEAVISGAGSVGSFSPGISQTSNPTNDSLTLSFASAKQIVAGSVDGRRARTMGDVRLLLGTDSYAFFAGLTPAGVGHPDALEWTMQNADVRASAFIAGKSSGIQRAVVGKLGARSAAYAPVWQGVRIIRDELTSADSGQVHLTAYLLAAFKVVDTASYTLRDLKLS